jgi:hypothetical protein
VLTNVHRLAVVALALGLMLAAVGSAQACSCIYVPPEKQLQRADGAAVLRLVDVREGGQAGDELVYRVGRVLKGAPELRRGRRIVVVDGSFQLCGPIRSVGRLTGLFLRRLDGHWTTGACSEISAAQMRRLADRQVGGSRAAGCAGSAAGT